MKNKKSVYTAPEAVIEILGSEDIVMISCVNDTINLDSDENVWHWEERDGW